MSEYFEKLDLDNYNTEFDFCLQNDFFALDEWEQLYKKRKITNEQWKQCIQHFNSQKKRGCYPPNK